MDAKQCMQLYALHAGSGAYPMGVGPPGDAVPNRNNSLLSATRDHHVFTSSKLYNRFCFAGGSFHEKHACKFVARASQPQHDVPSCVARAHDGALTELVLNVSQGGHH